MNEITVTRKQELHEKKTSGQDVVDLLLIANYIQTFFDEDRAGNPAKSL